MSPEDAEIFAEDFAAGLTLEEAKERARLRGDAEEALSSMTFGHEANFPAHLLPQEDTGIYLIGEYVADGSEFDPDETVPHE